MNDLPFPAVVVLVTQSCLTLCNPMDCSPSGSFVLGILQARILDWVAILFSRGYWAFPQEKKKKVESRDQSVWRMRGTSLWVFILIRQTEICSATPILFSFLSYLPRYFRQELERLDEGLRKEDMAVHVRRDHVFEDSYRELHRKSPEEMKNRL